MPPKEKEYDAVCLVIDVGQSSARSGFLATAIACASEQVQRKVYSESLDKFGIVLCGTSGTKNPHKYNNITLPDLGSDGLSLADFKLLEFVDKNVKALASDSEGDWLDAVVVALDHLKLNTDGTNVRSKRIILFSDLGSESSEEHLETISKAMIKEGVEFVFIGPVWKDDDDQNGHGHANGGASEDDHAHSKPKTGVQCASEAMVDCLVTKTNGLKLDVEIALAAFLNKERKKKKPFPWKVDLEIGNNIRIPVAGYIYVRREAPKSWKKCLAKASARDDDESWELKPETAFVKNDADMTVVEPHQLIESYRYGSELIAVQDVDKASLFDGGPKSLVVVGFIQQNEIPIHLAIGDGSMVFQPIEGNQSSIVALSALVNAMHAEEMVALVRRVYNARSAPKLAALVPSLKRDPETQEETTILTYIEMPFMEDIRYFNFAPLFNDAVKPSDEQLEAVDKLIDAITVDDPNLLRTETILNPYYQHLFQCLTHRALNPHRVLPSTSEHTRQIMEQPADIAQAAKEPLQKIKEVFKLSEVTFTKEKNTAGTFFSSAAKRLGSSQEDSASPDKRHRLDDLNLSAASQVAEVGTTTPAEDFSKLLQQGFDLSTVRVQIEKVIFNFIKTEIGDFSEKILNCLEAYRNACLDLKRPDPYNDFIRELKPEILASGSLSGKLWKQIGSQNLGLIDRQIERNSDVTQEEAEAFLKADDDKNESNKMDIDGEDEPPADDMFDDL